MESKAYMSLEVLPLGRPLRDGDSQPPQTSLDVPASSAEIVEGIALFERRSVPRFPCHREAWLHPVTLLVNAPWHAIVLDLSTKGIAFAIERSVKAGTFFAVELPDSLGGPPKRVRARVVHSTSQGHNYWHLGCVLETELTADEVQALVL